MLYPLGIPLGPKPKGLVGKFLGEKTPAPGPSEPDPWTVLFLTLLLLIYCPFLFILSANLDPPYIDPGKKLLAVACFLVFEFPYVEIIELL